MWESGAFSRPKTAEGNGAPWTLIIDLFRWDRGKTFPTKCIYMRCHTFDPWLQVPPFFLHTTLPFHQRVAFFCCGSVLSMRSASASAKLDFGIIYVGPCTWQCLPLLVQGLDFAPLGPKMAEVSSFNDAMIPEFFQLGTHTY